MSAESQKAKKASRSKKVVATGATDAVESAQNESAASSAKEPAQEGPSTEAINKEKTKVTLTLKGLDKRGRNAIYTGAAVSIRIPVGAFPNKTAPQSFEVSDGLAGPKEKKAPLTAEERKAARAAQPKLTLAEKVARAEERAAKLREKLASAAAAPVAVAEGAPA